MPLNHPPSFAVECVCGTWARGHRQPKPQNLTCTACGRLVFVFPVTASVFGAAGVSISTPKWRFWLRPAAAAILALAFVGLVISAVVRNRHTTVAAQESAVSPTPVSASDRMASARAALEDGSYHLARIELDAARDLLAGNPNALTSEQAAQLARWRRQTDLLANLLPESVSDIVSHSVGRADKEWDIVFRDRYAGKTVVLDARVVRTGAGQYHVDYHLEAAGAVGEWEFDKLRLLEFLPLQQPQRLFFGFRLRAIRRLSRDRWTVVPEPDSGVLLTDPIMLNGLSLPADEALNEVMRRQSKWESDG